MKAQSTFADRLSRIESGTTITAADVGRSGRLVQTAKPRRRLHWDMLFVGGLAGAVAGTLFAMNMGLLVLITLDMPTLYALVMADYLMAAYLGMVAIAPVGFVMSQIFARKNPRAWQFWIGYLFGVIGANYADLHTYYYILTTPAA